MKHINETETPRVTDSGRRRLMNGTYSIAVTAIVIAAILVINGIVAALPGRFTSMDVSDQKLYSIGDITKGVLDSLTEDVTLNLITQAGQEDEAVVKLCQSYEKSSDHIRLNIIDAVANPAFASQYTDETLPLNSVIAVCADRAETASYYNFYGYTSYYSDPAYWDAEGQITRAVAAAAFPANTKVYYTAGHDELAVSSEMADALAKANIESGELNLLSGDVPEDAGALIIYAPSQDFTEDEVKKVMNYLESGGRLLLVTMSEAVTGSGTPCLDRILSTYGVTRRGGLVMEGNESSYVQAPYLILPKTGNSEVTKGLENQNIICALPEAVDPGDTDEAVYTVLTVLSTDEDGYLKEEILDSVERSEKDETGVFALAISIEETPSQDSKGTPDVDLPEGTAEEEDESGSRAMRILYYSTPCLFSSAALSTLIQQQTALPEGNMALFSSSMAYLTDQEASAAVPAKSLQVPQTIIDTGTHTVLGLCMMVGLPLAVLLAGLIVFLRRRRR